MAPRKKTAAKKKTAKKTATRATRTKSNRVKHRETPLEKLAFRVSILEEGFDELERQMRENLPELREGFNEARSLTRDIARSRTDPEAIDVATEPANAIDEFTAHKEAKISDDEF
jgi:hypothetical protein